MPPKENEIEQSELFALEEQVADLKNALYDARIQLKSAICIPENATNGDMIKALFPDVKVEGYNKDVHGNPHLYCVDELDGVTHFTADWWDAPYKGTEG